MVSSRRVTILSTYFNVLDRIELDVELTDNPFGFEINELFQMGARVNPKRSFLFVSKLIGKHLSVHPDMPKATGLLLAHLLQEDIGSLSPFHIKKISNFVKEGAWKNPDDAKWLHDRAMLDPKDHTVFIGFAETATGLGHAVYSSFDNAHFVHTTREDLQMTSVFDFEEEHSHAVDHRCYLENDDCFKKSQHIVLIDDEMTTGKTSLNLIRSLHQKYPQKRYTILCLLDWRNESERDAYVHAEEELGAKIRVLSLTDGKMMIYKESHFEETEIVVEEEKEKVESHFTKRRPGIHQVKKTGEDVRYSKLTGRFGLSHTSTPYVEQFCKEAGMEIGSLRKCKQTLVLGLGEFMYLPSRIASYMGDGVVHKTTSRSPIHPQKVSGYPIHDRLTFVDDDEIRYHVYNIEKDQVTEVFIISEKKISNELQGKLTNALKKRGVEHVMFVFV